MNWTSALGYVAGMIGVAVLMATVSHKAERVKGDVVIRYGAPLRAFALLSALIPIVLTIPALQASPKDQTLAWSMVVLMTAISIYLILEFYFVRITFDDHYLHSISPWTTNRTIEWSNITSVSFSSLASWYVIKTGNHGKIRAHTGLSGLPELMKQISARCKIDDTTFK
jgi:hypothetical protein